MKFRKKYIVKNIVAIVIAAMFFYACTTKSNPTNVVNFDEVAAIVGKEVTIKYTDSGKLIATLKTPLLKDYTQLGFPYYEFPEGVKMFIYDKNGGQSTVVSDYAIQYSQTKLVDLQGNVEVITADSIRLNTQQLYWNQNLHWIYTDNDYTGVLKDGAKNSGSGFDVNEDFTNFRSRSNVGKRILED